jgi:hypothetical protein
MNESALREQMELDKSWVNVDAEILLDTVTVPAEGTLNMHAHKPAPPTPDCEHSVFLCIVW